MVFNNLEGNDIEYTLRLRHEVTDTNTWDTGSLAADPQLPEPRIRKWVKQSTIDSKFTSCTDILSLGLIQWVESFPPKQLVNTIASLPYLTWGFSLFILSIILTGIVRSVWVHSWRGGFLQRENIINDVDVTGSHDNLTTPDVGYRKDGSTITYILWMHNLFLPNHFLYPVPTCQRDFFIFRTLLASPLWSGSQDSYSTSVWLWGYSITWVST